MTRTTAACPHEEHLRRLVAGSLDDDAAQRMRAHLADCPWCQSVEATLRLTQVPLSDGEQRAAELVRTRLAGKVRAQRSRPREPESAFGVSARAVAAHLRAERVQCLGWLAAEGAGLPHVTVLAGARAEVRVDDDDLLSPILVRKQLEPMSPESWHPLAIYHLLAGCRAGGGKTAELGRAHRAILRAGHLGLDPAVVANERGVILLNEGNLFDAAASFLAALRLAPTLPVARANLALVCSRLDLVAIAPELWAEATAAVERSGEPNPFGVAVTQAEEERHRLAHEAPSLLEELASASPMARVRIAKERPALAHHWLCTRLSAGHRDEVPGLVPLASYLESVTSGRYLPALLARGMRDGAGDELRAVDEAWRSIPSLAESGQLDAAREGLEELIPAATRLELGGVAGSAMVLLERVRRSCGLPVRPWLLEQAEGLLTSPVYEVERAQALRALAAERATECCTGEALAQAQRAAELLRRSAPSARGPVLVELAELLLAAGCDAADLVFREAAAHEELTGGSRDRVAQCIEGRIRVERAREWPSLDAIERLVAARDALGPAGA